MTSVLGRKVDEPKIVSHSELSSAVQAGLAEAWTLFAQDGRVHKRPERGAQKQAPTSTVRVRTTGLKPTTLDKNLQPFHSASAQAPLSRNGVRLAWEGPPMVATTAASDSTGQRGDRTHPVASSAKQPLKKSLPVVSSTSGNEGNLPGLVHKSYPPYSNAQAVFGPPVDFKSSAQTHHGSTRPVQVKQTAVAQLPLTRKTTARQQHGVHHIPATAQVPIVSVELGEGTLAALRATVEKQKQAAQAKTSHATGSDYGQRGFQDSSGASVNTAALDSFHPLPPSSPQPPPAPDHPTVDPPSSPQPLSHHPTIHPPSRPLHGPSSPVQCKEETESDRGGSSCVQETKRKTVAIPAPRSYIGFSTSKKPINSVPTAAVAPPPPLRSSTRSTSAPVPPRSKPTREGTGGPQRRPLSTRAALPPSEAGRTKTAVFPRPPPTQPPPARVRKVCKTIPAASDEGGSRAPPGVITTSSWRDGKKLAERILAQEEGRPAADSGPEGREEGVDTIGSDAMLDGERRGSEAKGSYAHLPESAVRVLQDLEVEEVGGLAASRRPKTDSKQARSRPWREGAAFPQQPLPKKAKANPEPVCPPPKVRESNLEVKKFLQEKQDLRKRKTREEKLQKERAQKEKEERLRELVQRQRNMASACSKQQRTQQPEAHQVDTHSLASSAMLPPSVEDMAFDSNFLDDENTVLLHPATASDTLHSPLGSSQLSPVSSLASSSRGQLSASSSTSRIPVRTNPRPSLPLASYNSRTVVHPVSYDAAPCATPLSGLASHNFTSQSHPQSHYPPCPPTSVPSVMYRLPQSDRDDRLQALTQTALKLKERITHEMEQRRGTESIDLGFDHTFHPPKNPSLPPEHASARRNLMVKMVATTVSPTGLPGVGNMREHAEVSRKRVEEEAAAAKIQAAFRGYRVRRGMGGRSLRPDRLHTAPVPAAAVARVSPTYPHSGLGTPAPVPARGINLGTLPVSPQATPTKAQPSGPVLLATSPPLNLQAPVGDAYSVINVFNRQQEKLRETLSLRGASSLPQQQGPTHASSPLPKESHYSYTTSFEQQSLRSEGDPSRRAHSLGTGRTVTPPSVAISQSPYASNRSSPVLSKDPATPRQTTPTNTPTFRKDVSALRQNVTNRAEEPEVGEDGSLSSLSNSLTTNEHTASLRTEPTRHSSKTSPGAVLEEPSPDGGRLSPRSLQLKLQTELNLLESVEESMRCLSSVDETRAVAMAQSETATVAQLLASEKQLHAQEVRAAKSMVEVAVEERRKEEEGKGREALKEQVERVAHDARRLQEEAARKADEHAATLAKLQEDSTKVARDIAKQMAEAHSAATVAMVEATRQQMKAAQDMAASVAVAATKEAIKSALGRPEPLKTPSSSRSPRRSSPSPSQLSSARQQSHEYRSDFERSRSLQPGSKDLSTHTDTIRTEGTKALQSQGTSRPPSTEPEADRTLQSTSRPPSTEPEAQTGASRPSSTEPEANRTLQSRAGTSRPLSTEPEVDRLQRSRGSGHVSPSPSMVDTVSDIEDGQQQGEVETEEVEEEEELGGEDSERASSVATKEIDQSSKASRQNTSHKQRLSSVDNSDSEALVLSQGDRSPSSTPSGARHGDRKEDSFFLFRTRMVEQYMQEEELRAQHQATLLQLREKAIQEKAQAELEWLRVRKEKLERKGAIDMISKLMDKEKKVLKQLKLEQAEIRRLREVQRLASTERRLILLQHKEIGKLNRSTNYYRQKVKCYSTADGDKMGTQSPTPDREISASPSPSLHQDRKDLRSLQSPILEELSHGHTTSATVPAEDSEPVSTPTSSIHSQMMDVQPKTPAESPSSLRHSEMAGFPMSPATATVSKTTDSPTLKELKKIASSDAEKYLAHREKVLLRRRQAAEAALRQQEKLLKRERMLDKEEESVAKLVGKALQSFEQKLGGGHRKTKRRAGVVPAVEAGAPGDEGSGEEARAAIDNSRPDSATTAPSPDLPSLTVKEKTSVGHSVATEGQSHTHREESVDEELSHTQDHVDEELSHTQDHIDEELSGLPEEQMTHPKEEVEEDLSHSKQGNTDGDVVVTQLEHTSSNTHGASTRQRPTETSQTQVHSEYNNDTFESFRPSKLTSTPSQQRLSVEEETLTVAESISEGAVSGVSSVEGRILVLKEQLRQRKEEAKRLQSEQRRRRKAVLREQEEQLKKQIEATDKVIFASKMASLPTSDISSPSSTAGSPLPDQARGSARSPSPRSAVPTTKQLTPQPAAVRHDDVVTPTHPTVSAHTATPTTYSQFTQPLETQKSVPSHHDSVEEVLSESPRSSMLEDQQRDQSVRRSPSTLPHLDEKLLSEYTAETFEKSSHLSPPSSSHKAESEEEELSSLGKHETGAEERSNLGDHLTGEEPLGLDKHKSESEEYSSHIAESEASSLEEHTAEPEPMEPLHTAEPEPMEPLHTAEPELMEPSSVEVQNTGPEDRKSVQKDVMSKIGPENTSVVHEQSKDGDLVEEVLEEEIEEEEEEEEDDDQFYSISKKVEMRRDEVQDIGEEPTKKEEPMTGRRDEKKADTEKPETVVGVEMKELLEEEEEKDKDEDGKEEEEEKEESIEEEEIQQEEETEEEGERQATMEVESKQSADNILQLVRGRNSISKGLTTLEHGPEAPRAKSPVGVEAAMATQILEITEDGPVSPELAGDVGSNQPTAPSSTSMPLVTTLSDGVKEKSVAVFTEDLVQELANEAFETMYQLVRSRRGRATHGKLEEKGVATVVVKQDKDATLTREQKADKITDDLLALLVRSESMYMNGLLSGREVQRSPDCVTAKYSEAPSSPPLSPLHQHTFEANIHMPCSSRHPGGDLECAVLPHHSPSGAVFGVHSPPPGTHSPPSSAHPLPSDAHAHPPQPQALPPQAELAPRPSTPAGSSSSSSHCMVSSDRRSVNTVCEYAWHTFQRIGVDGLHTPTDVYQCPQELHAKLYNAGELGEEEVRCRQHYVDLVYNVAMEMIKELHPKQVPEPVWSHGCTKGGKLVTKDLKLPAELTLLQNKVYATLTKGQKPPTLSGIKFLSGMKRPGGREIDFVDALLIKELRDEEPSWTDYSQDETQVKIALADSILDNLINETVGVLITIEGRRNGRRY